MRLLVVDWDYFFPIVYDPNDPTWPLYDWGHREAGDLYRVFLWSSRASSFVSYDLPIPVANDEWRIFWDRFEFADGCQLDFSDSNLFAYDYPDATEIWLFDAHHDSGYNVNSFVDFTLNNRIYCDNWMFVHHLNGAELHMRYPTWKKEAFDLEPEPAIPVDRQFDDGQPFDEPFDWVYVCQSQSWTPPWEDQHFQEFLYLADLDVNQVDDTETIRPFSMDEVHQQVAMVKDLRARHEESRTS